MTVPATGGLFSAFIIFVFVLHMIVPGITVQADPNDIPTGLLQPAELISLSDYPVAVRRRNAASRCGAAEQTFSSMSLWMRNGQMITYDIISGSDSPDVRHHLDQMLIFSRFRPMLSFGRPTAGGHVVLSFSAVHVRG